MKEIIEGLKKKDKNATDELLKYYSPLMKYIISPILANEQDQEECISEIIIKVWQKIDTFDNERGTFNAWLTAITRNTAINYAKKVKYHVSDIPESMPSSEPTPEQIVIQKETALELKKAINTLSEQEKILFYRKYYYLQPTKQIASELGLSERAVEGRLYRLKIRLRKLLGGD